MRLLFVGVTIFIGTINFAQTPLTDSINRKRQNINRVGLTILGSWALLNIGTGVIGQTGSLGVQTYFYKTNIMWGGANLLLAGIGFFAGKPKFTENSSESFRRQIRTEKLFLLNTALDLGYVVFGLYTRERAARFTRDNRNRLLGTGKSFLVQGTFLAVFDGMMYLLHVKNGARLYRNWQNLSFRAGESGIGLVYRF